MARLIICDLAGSERANRTQTTGTRLKEASNINQSLVVLGRCLETLRWNQSHTTQRVVPFRESKITRLFQSTLVGHGTAVMLVNVSPCSKDIDETICALRYASVARDIVNIHLTPVGQKRRAPAQVWPPTPVTFAHSTFDINDVKTVEVNVRQELSQKWAESLQSQQLVLQRSSEQCQEYQKEYFEYRLQSQRALYQRKVDELKRDIDDKNQLIKIRMSSSQNNSVNMSSFSILGGHCEDVENTQIWRTNTVGYVERLLDEHRKEMNIFKGRALIAEQELNDYKNRMETKQKQMDEDYQTILNQIEIRLEDSKKNCFELQSKVTACEKDRTQNEEKLRKSDKLIADLQLQLRTLCDKVNATERLLNERVHSDEDCKLKIAASEGEMSSMALRTREAEKQHSTQQSIFEEKIRLMEVNHQTEKNRLDKKVICRLERQLQAQKDLVSEQQTCKREIISDANTSHLQSPRRGTGIAQCVSIHSNTVFQSSDRSDMLGTQTTNVSVTSPSHDAQRTLSISVSSSHAHNGPQQQQQQQKKQQHEYRGRPPAPPPPPTRPPPPPRTVSVGKYDNCAMSSPCQSTAIHSRHNQPSPVVQRSWNKLVRVPPPQGSTISCCSTELFPISTDELRSRKMKLDATMISDDDASKHERNIAGQRPLKRRKVQHSVKEEDTVVSNADETARGNTIASRLAHRTR
jgi:hypothetical protein